jgi:hypothetical protein
MARAYTSWRRAAVSFAWRSPIGIPMEIVVTRLRFATSDAIPIAVSDEPTRPIPTTNTKRRPTAMKKLILGLGALLVAGCGTTDDMTTAPLPACDTLRAVFFVQRCNLSDKAECRLYASAPAGSMGTGCTVPVVDASSGAVTLLECEESCK